MYTNILKHKNLSALAYEGLSSLHLYVYLKKYLIFHARNPLIYYCFGIIKEGLIPFFLRHRKNVV